MEVEGDIVVLGHGEVDAEHGNLRGSGARKFDAAVWGSYEH